MASAADIATVRANVDEPDDTNGFTDVVIGGLIDDDDVIGATIVIWERKAATFSSLVNTSEAGASHSFSDLYKNATAMANYWTRKAAEADTAAGTAGRPKVHKMVRD